MFWHGAFLEVFNPTINLNPEMFRLLENRSDGGWGLWVCQRADGNADQRGQILGLPVDG
jgi:hypothetical protein